MSEAGNEMSIIGQFKKENGPEALEACILKNSASNVSGEEANPAAQQIFVVANDLLRLVGQDDECLGNIVEQPAGVVAGELAGSAANF